ncbi:MAG TPA: TadE family protein [Terriglobales bacterium]|nr:TadE family protein [Terriglobales bacterium]
MKRNRAHRGATLVEAALTLMLLLMLIMGVVEFGRIFNLYQVVTNAAREGGRYSVAPQPNSDQVPTTAQISNYVYTFTDAAGLPRANNCGTGACPPGNPDGACVCVNAASKMVNGVTVSYREVYVGAPYVFITPMLLLGASDVSVTINGRAKMRNEVN